MPHWRLHRNVCWTCKCLYTMRYRNHTDILVRKPTQPIHGHTACIGACCGVHCTALTSAFLLRISIAFQFHENRQARKLQRNNRPQFYFSFFFFQLFILIRLIDLDTTWCLLTLNRAQWRNNKIKQHILMNSLESSDENWDFVLMKMWR